MFVKWMRGTYVLHFHRLTSFTQINGTNVNFCVRKASETVSLFCPQFTALNGLIAAAAVAITADILTMNQPTIEAEARARVRKRERERVRHLIRQHLAYCMFRLYFKQPLISACAVLLLFAYKKSTFKCFAWQKTGTACAICRIIILSYFAPARKTPLKTSAPHSTAHHLYS